MRKKLWIPTAAGGAALALVATTGIATALHKNDVELVVDGVSTTIAVREKTVGDLMELEGITLDEHDVLLPSADTRISDGMEVSVAYGRPLTVVVDGETREVWTTAQNVGDALAFLNLDDADAKLSASRSTQISREGLSLELATPQDVTLTLQGTPTELSIAGTVSDVLTAVGVVPDEDDIVTPAADTTLTDGLEIAFVDVEVKSSTKSSDIPFTKTSTTSSDMLKGTEKVTTKGVNGATRETYSDVYHDGTLFSSTLQETVISRQPVQQVTTVGTKVVVEKAPEPKKVAAPKTAAPEKAVAPKKEAAPKKGAAPKKEAAPKKASESTPTEEAAAPSSSSGKAINLARSDMWDRIASCESGNNWSINTGNGYYGGLQFNQQTWRSVNGQDFAALPHQASRAEQITVANRLYAQRGTQPWSCA